MKSRAYVLVLTLCLGFVVFALLLAAAPGAMLSTLQLDTEERRLDQDDAAGVTESAVSALLYTNDFSGDLSWQNATLTFKPNADGHSLNNAGSNNTATGWGNRQVPPGQVHLVGTARSRHLQRVRQALVQPFHQVLYEDFNQDGNGGAPWLPWVHLPGTSGWAFQNKWCYMGSPQYQQNQEQFMVYPAPRWNDYDFQAHVAYYGTTSFGFSVHSSENFDGYRLEMQPRIGLEEIDGMDITVSALPGEQADAIPYPDPAQNLQDDVFKVKTDITEAPAQWTFQVSVRGSQLWLSVWDSSQNAFRQVGSSFDLSKFDDKLNGKTFPSGGVGVWADVVTGIGVTDLSVLLQDRTLMRRNARWEDE